MTLKYNEIIRAHEYYQCGASLSKTSNKFGETRQMIHYYFKKLGLSCRPLKRTEQIIYNKNNYTRNTLGYWRKTIGNRELLHRQKWMDNNGAIPQGYEIHHIDENKDNNDLDNYLLISTSDHTKLHGFKNNQYTKKNPHKYIYGDDPGCIECDNPVFQKDKTPSYNNARIFCSQHCRYKHRKNKPRGYSVIRIIKIAKGLL